MVKHLKLAVRVQRNLKRIYNQLNNMTKLELVKEPKEKTTLMSIEEALEQTQYFGSTNTPMYNVCCYCGDVLNEASEVIMDYRESLQDVLNPIQSHGSCLPCHVKEMKKIDEMDLD